MYSNCYLKFTSSSRLQNQWLASVNITEEDIYLLFKNLNLEKAHDWMTYQLGGSPFVEKLLCNLYKSYFCHLKKIMHIETTGRKERSSDIQKF